MSRLTSAQIIEKGDYLKPGFDPSTLTVSQLLGVLGFHSIRYPTPYSKPKLIQIFNDRIASNAEQLSEASRSDAEPSDDGITDGITGELISNQRPSSRASAATPRRKGGGVGKTPVKRRKSSRSATRARRAPSPVVIEDSDGEEDIPKKPIKRRRSSKSASHRTSEAQDSGWEDNNAFQTGPDYSSPTRRSSTTPRQKNVKGYQASSVATSPSPPPVARKSLPPVNFPPWPQDLRSSPPRTPERTPAVAEVQGEYYTTLNDTEPAEDVEEEAILDGVSDNVGTETDGMDVPQSPPIPRSAARFLNLFVFGLALTFLHMVVIHKTELAEIGYCDPGMDSNAYLEKLLARRGQEAENCRLQQTHNMTSESQDGSCPPPAILPFLYPTQCTPCPPHGTCSQHSLKCDKGFLLQKVPPLPIFIHEAFEYVPMANASDYGSRILNAFSTPWPYLQPICIPDVGREHNLGTLRRSIATFLAEERGRRLCAGDSPGPGEDDSTAIEAAMRWGVTLEVLKDKMADLRSPKPAKFDEMFEEALREVSIGGDVFTREDSSGTVYVAHTRPWLPWYCGIVVKVRQAWVAWRLTLFGFSFLATGIILLRYRRGRLNEEKRKAAELVQEVLEVLQTQEMAHHTDSVSNPVPYYSSDQLRDYVLQEEHSVGKRQRVWEQVSRIVEENANVRVNHEETSTGDEVRVWRWVGRARGPRKSLQNELVGI